MSYTVFIYHRGHFGAVDTGTRFERFGQALDYMDAMYEANKYESVVYETGREFKERPLTSRPRGTGWKHGQHKEDS